MLNFLVKSTPGASGGAATNGHHPTATVTQPVAAPVVAPPEPLARSCRRGVCDCGDGDPGTSGAELEAFLINFVVEQTGYPAEVVDLDADLEADLGIDSIKKAQLFGELQEYFDVGALAGSGGGGSLSLDDFTTLRHVLDFLVQSQSGAASTAGIEQVVATTDPAPAVATLFTQSAPATTAENNSATADDTTQRASELEAFLINFVVEQTGYPAEVVDLDADLEADLGIDSIKKAQLFGELQEYFNISALAGGAEGGSLSLDDFTTLRHVLNFLMGAAGTLPASSVPADDPIAQGNRLPAGGVDVARPTFAEAIGTSPTIELEGTPYEIGWQHGRQFKADIRRILRHYADCVGEQLDELPGQASRIAPERALSADELDELQGLADAVEVPLGNLLAHQLTLMAESGQGAVSWRRRSQQPAVRGIGSMPCDNQRRLSVRCGPWRIPWFLLDTRRAKSPTWRSPISAASTY